MPSDSLPEDFDPFAGAQLLSAVPSTEPQREVWTSSQISPDANLAYNESVSVVLDGPLDPAAMEAALRQLVQRHEALRSTFSGDGEKLLVNAGADVPFLRVDLSSRPEPDRAAELAALLDGAVTTPFDLAKGPLARAELVKLSPTRHQLIFTAHHIVCDGWSAAVLMKDWGQLYSALAAGKPAALPPADPISAYATEISRQERTPTHDADEAYWTNRFAGEAPVLELPADRPRPPLKTYASRREDAVLPEELVTRIKKAGSKERVSLFAMLLAGFHALLSRLSNQNDVVVGIPAAGQAAEGHQELVGHAVSMLPIRAQLDPHKPVKALLSEVRLHLLDAQEHQSFTIGSLLKKLPIKRDPSRLPLMSVIFNVDRGVGPAGLPFSGLQGQLSANARRFETYELFVNAVEYAGKITLECQYNADLFDQATIRRWLHAYERLMRGVVEDLEGQKGAPLGSLPLLSDDELRQLDAWNAESALPVDGAARVHDLIAAQARRTPDAPAIRFEGRQLTYRQLDARADALAGRLRELGVRRGQRVGLAVERSPEMVVGLYGILKSGAAYVPLDPGYPKDRLAFMVQDGALEVVVTQKQVAQELELKTRHLVLVEDLPAAADPLSPSADDAQTEDAAYVIYTSGSTGKPKGVQVPHRAVVNILHSCQRTPGMTAKDVVLAVTTLSFDIAVSELILPFTTGATVEIASREVASDGARLLALLKKSGATFMDATPATYRLLLSAGWTGGDLHKCICTGEAMPRDLAQELVKRVPSVWNGYGPTETTVWSSFYEVRAPVEKILIGKPVANTQLHVLDAQRQRAPLGVIGELYIGGRGVTLGYLGRPELTRERFVPNPFGDGLLYRTGDLVRYHRDGNLECLGRNDNQVKVRGFRIELGEIEDQLTQHPAVKQAAVVVREMKADDVRLVGYVVQHAGQSAADADLRAHLKKSLPEYMVPAHLIKLDRMPLTPSGKIDRKALPAPDVSAGLAGAFVAPRTDTERGLAEIWQQILSVGRVGATDDFFALGGHSLLASQLLARVQQRFGAQLSFRKIFEAPTVEKLAALVDASKGQGAPSPIPSIPRRPAGTPAPLSVAQARLVLLEQMDPGTRLVHALNGAWRLRGPMNVEAMRRAFAELLARHESLRSNLRVEPDGKQVQVVRPDRTLSMELLDLSAPAPDERRTPEERVRAALLELGQREYDLEKDPLVRLTLARYGAEDHALLLGVHNFAWDGWSFDLFLKEMAALYTAFAQGKPSPLPPLQVSYGDFAAWQQQLLESDEAKRQAAYWQKQLSGEVLPLEVPTDSPRMGSRSSAGANEGIRLSAELQDALVAMAQREGTTLFAALFAAFNVLLFRYTGHQELMVGCPVRARTRPELEDVIGPFTNNVILRTRIEDGMTFLGLLRHVKDVTLDAFSHQEVPIERLGVKPPLLRAYFSLQDARTRPVSFGPLQLEQVNSRAPTSANELMLWTMQRPEGLLAMLNYSTDLFRPESMQRMLRQLETLLGEVLKDPQRPALHLPILPDDERQRLADWADPGDEGAQTLFDGLESR
ncbi:MAG TPA: amino acid adenylation domain-containing protein, partial [Myxococcales bacterium]|nr:amino acid adenylation domain-containing protein [Myxococcales bacterium]